MKKINRKWSSGVLRKVLSLEVGEELAFEYINEEGKIIKKGIKCFCDEVLK